MFIFLGNLPLLIYLINHQYPINIYILTTILHFPYLCVSDSSLILPQPSMQKQILETPAATHWFILIRPWFYVIPADYHDLPMNWRILEPTHDLLWYGLFNHIVYYVYNCYGCHSKYTLIICCLPQCCCLFTATY